MTTIDTKSNLSRATFNQLRAAENKAEAAAPADAPKTDNATVTTDTLLQHAAAMGTTADKLKELVENAGMGPEIDEAEMDSLFDQVLGDTPPPTPEQKFELPPGQILMSGQTNSDTVKQLQTALGELQDPNGKPYFEFQGETVSGPTGNFHGVTEDAVKRFQADHGLPVDGKVGPATAAALNQALAAQQAVKDAEQPVLQPAAPQTPEEQAIATGENEAVQQAIANAGTDQVALGRVADLLPAGDPRKEALQAIALGQVKPESVGPILDALKDQQYTPGDLAKAAQACGGDPATLNAMAAVARYKASLNEAQGNADTAKQMAGLADAFKAIAGASPAVAQQLALAFDDRGNDVDWDRALAAATTAADADALKAWLAHEEQLGSPTFGGDTRRQQEQLQALYARVTGL